MSVFTTLIREEFSSHLSHYGITKFEFAPVLDGTQNTIYRIITADDDYLLIIYEKSDVERLASTLKLIQYLAQQAFPTNPVIADKNGVILQTIQQKPAILLGYLSGTHCDQLTPTQLCSLGETVAMLHILTNNLELSLPPSRNSAWRIDIFEKIKPRLSSSQLQLINLAFAKTQHLDDLALPQGIIHADLFLDNLLFDKNKLSGVIDFFDATHGILLYDLAIAAIDTCLDQDGLLDNQRCRHLLDAYEKIRPLTTLERQAWPMLCLLATLTFWLLRLHNLSFPKPGLEVKQKDPKQMEIIITHELLK